MSVNCQRMGKLLDWLLTSRSGNDPSIKKEVRRLPKVMPADFKIRIAEFEIKNNLVTAIHYVDGVERKYQFDLTPDQMGELYQVLQKNKFDRIKIIDDVRLDGGGGEFIRVDWANTYIAKGSSQAHYIHKKWEENYSLCYYELIKVLRDVVKLSLRPLKIVIDEKLIAADPGYVISISDSLTPYLYMTRLERLPKDPDFTWREQSYEGTIIPGYTEVTVSNLSKPSHEEIELRLQFPEGKYDTLTLHLFEESRRIVYQLEFQSK